MSLPIFNHWSQGNITPTRPPRSSFANTSSAAFSNLSRYSSSNPYYDNSYLSVASESPSTPADSSPIFGHYGQRLRHQGFIQTQDFQAHLLQSYDRPLGWISPTPSSGYIQGIGSASVPRERLWNPPVTLEILNTDPGYQCLTCTGHAPSQGRRCRNTIRRDNTTFIMQTLDKMAYLPPSSQAVVSLLRAIVGPSLCVRYHQSQAENVIMQWQRKIQHLGLRSQNEGHISTSSSLSRNEQDGRLEALREQLRQMREAVAQLQEEINVQHPPELMRPSRPGIQQSNVSLEESNRGAPLSTRQLEGPSLSHHVAAAGLSSNHRQPRPAAIASPAPRQTAPSVVQYQTRTRTRQQGPIATRASQLVRQAAIFSLWNYKSPSQINKSILNRLNKPLGSKGELTGYVYILASPSFAPGYLKIGYTTRSIECRRSEISRKCSIDFHAVIDEDQSQFRYCYIVERLVHIELNAYRRSQQCECGTEHQEWFEIDEERALEVVGRWRRWVIDALDSAGQLKPYWRAKANLLNMGLENVNWETWTQPALVSPSEVLPQPVIRRIARQELR